MESSVHIKCKVSTIHGHSKMVEVSISQVDSIQDQSAGTLIQALRTVLKVRSLLRGVEEESIESGQPRNSCLCKYISVGVQGDLDMPVNQSDV